MKPTFSLFLTLFYKIPAAGGHGYIMLSQFGSEPSAKGYLSSF